MPESQSSDLVKVPDLTREDLVRAMRHKGPRIFLEEDMIFEYNGKQFEMMWIVEHKDGTIEFKAREVDEDAKAEDMVGDVGS